MSDPTHAIFDTLSGVVVKTFPNIAEAFKHNAEIGGPMKGYIVAPINRPPVKKTQTRNDDPEYIPDSEDYYGPGLFD